VVSVEDGVVAAGSSLAQPANGKSKQSAYRQSAMRLIERPPVFRLG